MWFNSIPVETLMGMLGDYSGRTVCLGAGVVGDVFVKVENPRPWDEVAVDVSHRYGFRAMVDNKYLYVFKP